jgi:hypothetical protein
MRSSNFWKNTEPGRRGYLGSSDCSHERELHRKAGRMAGTQPGVTIRTGPKQKSADPAKRRSIGSVDLYAPLAVRPFTLLISLLVFAVLFVGWHVREEEYLTAESGLGYALGIGGGVLMLLLLLYSLRKRVRFLRNWGATKYWFRAHMILGVVGPVLVLFHANFRGGSLNSTVALVSMLVVAGSGFAGRYIYSKIHYGLYGSRMNLEELKYEIENYMTDVVWVLSYAPKVHQRLLAFDNAALRPSHSFLRSVWQFVLMELWAPWTYFVLLRDLRRALRLAARRAGWSALELQRRRREAHRYLSAHMTAAIRVAEFSVYERLFALWHLLHVPLVFILVIAVAVHVLAVHMY